MPRVVHFEIVSDDPEETKEFYQKVFDWKARKWKGPMDYWFLQSADDKQPGIEGAFGLRQSPDDTIVDTISVDDIDKYIELVKAEGGEIIRPKSPVPGVGWLVYFRDTEGNSWGMMEDDLSAE